MDIIIKIKLAIKLFRLVIKYDLDIYTLISIIHNYSEIMLLMFRKSNKLPERSNNALSNLITRSSIINGIQADSDNQHNLNSLTESIRKHGLTWINNNNNVNRS